MRIAGLAIVPAALSLLAGCAATRPVDRESVIYGQPAIADGAKVGLGFYSSSHARPKRNYKRADDFTLTCDASVTRVRWWGLSEGRIFDDARNFDRFTVEIYEGIDGDAGPLPGALVWSSTFEPAALAITPTGRTSPTSGAAEYAYEAVLGAPVRLRARTPYLVAISARSVDAAGDAWQWQDGELGAGHGANYSYATAAWSAFQDTDSAFELIGGAGAGRP